MHRTALIALLSFLALPCLIAADASPAAGIAAKVIRERAAEIERGGQAAVAGELRALAEQLAAGTVTLADAALVVQIALAGNTSRAPMPLQTAEQRRAAEQAAARATLILDGDEPYAPSAGKPASATPAIDEQALAIPIATSVLIADWVGDPKALLVMIGVGRDQHVTTGQRFVVKRGEQKLVVISATQVKESSTICMAIAGTLAEGVQIKPGDAVVSE
ncbi:MAG: hypothetical protein H0W78_14715 [Planctomycetes bacterium]|nr:hypothetical protein [Planctomycetota bacterium]